VTDENQVVITGAVCKAPETRHSPAGVPLTRFTVEHRARRIVNGIARETWFRIVVAAAAELGRSAAALAAGDRVRIRGFLSRSDWRKDERHVTLHAESIERLQQQQQNAV
jgi:primosomal replication protein N